MLLLIVEVDVGFCRLQDRGLFVPSNEVRLVGGCAPCSQRVDHSLMGGGIAGGHDCDSDSTRTIWLHEPLTQLGKLRQKCLAEWPSLHWDRCVDAFMLQEAIQPLSPIQQIRGFIEYDGIAVECQPNLVWRTIFA
jgi:hypothetical protein